MKKNASKQNLKHNSRNSYHDQRKAASIRKEYARHIDGLGSERDALSRAQAAMRAKEREQARDA